MTHQTLAQLFWSIGQKVDPFEIDNVCSKNGHSKAPTQFAISDPYKEDETNHHNFHRWSLVHLKMAICTHSKSDDHSLPSWPGILHDFPIPSQLDPHQEMLLISFYEAIGSSFEVQ